MDIMEHQHIHEAVSRLNGFFNTGATRDPAFRIAALKKLAAAIRSAEGDIMRALREDLRKPEFESYAGEIGILYPEIKHMIGRLGRWTRARRVPTPILHFPSRSVVYREPYGTALIVSPWNYPFQLTAAPLIAAIAAGNCVLIKPSELSPATSQLIGRLMGDTFDPAHVAVVQGGIETATAVLEEKFDIIFYTGSTAVGRVVMTAAAKHLTPVVLELGGKSPVIVEATVRLDYAARRIAWGKFFNAGQTCLAPDYLLVQRAVYDAFTSLLVETIRRFYGVDPRTSPDYARIINDRHFLRLESLMQEGEILHGGKTDREQRYLEPTLFAGVEISHRIMQEEIFGPLLPVIAYDSLDEAVAFVNRLPRPLALYYFTGEPDRAEALFSRVHSGGACVNDTVSHVGSHHLPFGGIGDSGMGAYHGRWGFEAFTHRRGVLYRSNRLDMPLRYPPYGERVGLLKRLFRILG
jgi:acyl-CoA reductase-like NAD-dependent aldehyde dehydrogenase